MCYKILNSDEYGIYLRDEWFEYNNTLIKGNAFINGKLYKGIELARYIDSISIYDIEKYNNINGYFCGIKIQNNLLQIISDKVRSFPIFYLFKENKVYISDDPYELKRRFNIEKQDDLSRNELLLLRYVTGEDTLYEDIKQNEAAQIINFTEGKKFFYKYYRFLGKHNISGSKQFLLEQHEKVLKNIFNRLIEYANGRTIVLSLSGGYDSRLIAVMLKKLDYKNIITFTYGKEGHPEQIISKMVADNLGYKWIFIPYNKEKTFKWYNSEEYNLYQEYADNLSSTCFDREWPAVFELKQQGLIPDDSLFVPGHSGDFLSGRLLPYDLCRKQSDIDTLVETILTNHYTMWNWSGKKSEFREDLKTKFIKTSEINKSNIIGNNLDFYDKWEWQERQAKYIINSVRIYEYFGYDWWLPLWDNEIIDYWTNISNVWRKDRSLYSYHVALLYSKVAKISVNKALVREETLNDSIIKKSFKLLKNFIKKTPFEYIARKIFSIGKRIRYFIKPRNNFYYENLQNDWEQASGRLHPNLYDKLSPYFITRDSCKTLQRLGYINTDDDFVSEDVINILKEMKG